MKLQRMVGGLEFTADVGRHMVSVTGPYIAGKAEWARNGRASAEYDGHRAITYAVDAIVLPKLSELAELLRTKLMPGGKRMLHGPNVSLLAADYVRVCELLEGREI